MIVPPITAAAAADVKRCGAIADGKGAWGATTGRESAPAFTAQLPSAAIRCLPLWGTLNHTVVVSLPELRTRVPGVERGLISAAALALCAATVAHAPVAFAQGAAQRASPAPAARAAPAWKQLYEDNQTIYYLDTSNLPKGGASSATSLLEYKAPQVIGGAQVWSIVTHMKLNCDQNQMVTTDNTLYALKMGGGPIVQSQPANDTWHAPLEGTLGALVWGAACPKP
jgi:hypothetical protein